MWLLLMRRSLVRRIRVEQDRQGWSGEGNAVPFEYGAYGCGVRGRRRLSPRYAERLKRELDVAGGVPMQDSGRRALHGESVRYATGKQDGLSGAADDAIQTNLEQDCALKDVPRFIFTGVDVEGRLVAGMKNYFCEREECSGLGCGNEPGHASVEVIFRCRVLIDHAPMLEFRGEKEKQ